MLKIISYPIFLVAILLIMGHTRVATVRDHAVSSGSPLTLPDHGGSSSRTNHYAALQLGNLGLSQKAFDYAMKGFKYLQRAGQVSKSNIVSIVDFSRPSNQKRLFVIDLNRGKVLYNTWVAHGRNSGDGYARQFSNSPESHQSSLGFYITLGTYVGAHGYSLRLKGCERGINDKAYERAIVIHGADYVSKEFINSRGGLGRSYGCPAVSNELSKPIIDVIKDGSCLFVYHPTKTYRARSRILNKAV